MQIEYRKSGISLIGDLPWGSHICQFYQSKKDLLDVLVPYFRAGLQGNELCVWVTTENLDAAQAKKALEQAVPHFGDYARSGQMEIIPYRRWVARGGKSGKAIVAKVDKAVCAGFDGVRLACAAPKAGRRGGKVPTCCGTGVIDRYNVVAVYTYPRAGFDALGLMEVVKDHRAALLRNAGRWEVIESAGARTARDALRRSEEKLQSLFSNMSEGFAYHRIVLDPRGRPCDYIFLETNDAFGRLTGLARRDIIGRKVTEVLPGIEKDPADWIGKYGSVALTGTPVQFESYAHLLKRWYLVSAFSPHRGFFAVTVSDITERKRADQALLQGNMKLEILADAARLLLSGAAPDRIVQTICERVMDYLGCHVFFNYLIDEDKGRLHLNAYAGVSEETARELGWLDVGAAVCGSVAQHGRRIIAGDICNTPDERTDLVRSFGIQAYACHPLIYKDKTIGTLSFGTRSRSHFSDEDIELMKAITDLAATAMARKRAEESAMRAKEEWELTFDSVPDLIAIIDNQHRIIRVNEPMARRLGLRPEECIGLPCYRHVHGSEAPPSFCPHCRTLSDGTEHVEEVHEQSLGGDFLVSTTPLRDKQGRMFGSVHVAHDITERKKAGERIMSLNEQLKEKIGELTEANRELEAFSYSVSHDLRSPLRSIDGFSQVLLEDYAGRLDENGADLLRRVRTASQRMGLLIDGLLNLARLSRSEVSQGTVDLSALAADIAGGLRKASPGRKVEFVITEDMRDEGDERLIYIVLQNLLGNAWKFSEGVAKARVEFGVEETAVKTYFVRDNGAGFDMAYADKLFRPFHRLHDAADFPGTGIGLATVQRIIFRHGGRVWAEGAAGKGAVFYFTLKPVPASGNDRKEEAVTAG